ncbi:MAG TPA: hypothetical protein VHR40_05040 [Thermoleophilaceae bacterium]|nr:hypothetical protein [Thermoleophilaceae bacterium]
MSATLTEQPGTGISPPARPSIWRVGWATFVGYFLTVLLGLVVVIPLSTLGISAFDTASRGLFLHYDVWSWLAEACAGLLATWITAFFVSDSLRNRTGWEVPFSFAFLTLLLTGYAPLLAVTPLYGATAPVSLVAATLILHWRAEPAGAEPMSALGAVPRRYRRRVVIGLAVAGPLMFGYVVAYGVTHPLHTGAYRSGTTTWAHHPGQLKRYELYIENPGPFEVSDFSIVGVEGSPALQLERVGVEARNSSVDDPDHPSPAPLHPLGDYAPGPDISGGPITLELREGRVCPTGIAKLDAVRVRYTLLDGRHEQRIPLQQPPQVRCP